jgi:hypothetical protein
MPTNRHLISRRTTFAMPKITKGPNWMTLPEIIDAINTLEAYEPTLADKRMREVRDHRLAGLYAELDVRAKAEG